MAGNRVATLPLSTQHNLPWFYFDAEYYIEQCIDRGIAPPLGTPEMYLQHYVSRGARIGLSPNPFFDEDYYRRKYPDVARGIQLGTWDSGLAHFFKVGSSAGFSPVWFFDAAFYQNMNPDLTAESLRFGRFPDFYSHFLLVGIGEKRAAHWSCRALLQIKGDDGYPKARLEWQQTVTRGCGLMELFQPLFDFNWMKEKYNWPRAIRPHEFIRHYILHVAATKMSPSPYFDEVFYLIREPEVQQAVDEGHFVSGYEHFLMHGMYEWRPPFAGFDPHYYFRTNILPEGGDLQAAASTPSFVHFLQNRNRKRLPISPPLITLDIPEPVGKALYERRCALNAGRLNGVRLASGQDTPDISIIIVARDNYEQTANCIVSAAINSEALIEVIVFDNASTDATRDIQSVNPNIKYIREEKNIGFTIPVNRAAERATAPVILLLNNDVELTPRAIDLALELLNSDPSIGVVGAKIVRMHGRLQEAGSIIWRDGSCQGYGRDRDPMDGQVSFVRDVDFCSGCFIAVRRSDWDRLGGFDEAYAPAYYEETDFCVRVWERGLRVVYDPRIVIWHFEFGSSAIREEPLALMRRNQRYFVSRHRDFLAQCLPPAGARTEQARLRHVRAPRVLFIEDMLPDPHLGMGFTRSAIVAKELETACGLVSVLGLHTNSWPGALAGDALGRKPEMLTGVNVNSIIEFFQDRIGVYDRVWLSRTHNLARLREWKAACPQFFEAVHVILDTEAVAASRLFAYARQANRSADLNELVLAEMEHLEGVHHICAVSRADRSLLMTMLRARGISIPVSILGHSQALSPHFPVFDDTSDIVIAGSFSQTDGPNADALLWFDKEIRPLLPPLPGLRYVIAGNEALAFARKAGLQHDYHIINNPADMAAVFRKARVMVAPTRFAAGVPIKVYDAAAHGVPVAMTELLAAQLSWQSEQLAAAAAEAEPMARLITRLATDRSVWLQCQEAQAAFVRVDCDALRFRAVIRAIIADPSTAHIPDGAPD